MLTGYHIMQHPTLVCLSLNGTFESEQKFSHQCPDMPVFAKNDAYLA